MRAQPKKGGGGLRCWHSAKKMGVSVADTTRKRAGGAIGVL